MALCALALLCQMVALPIMAAPVAASADANDTLVGVEDEESELIDYEDYVAKHPGAAATESLDPLVGADGVDTTPVDAWFFALCPARDRGIGNFAFVDSDPLQRLQPHRRAGRTLRRVGDRKYRGAVPFRRGRGKWDADIFRRDSRIFASQSASRQTVFGGFGVDAFGIYGGTSDP